MRQTVELPERLIAFLKYANQLIVAQDETASTPSDDLIQIEEFRGYFLAYGGLIDEGGSRFAFVYFAEPKQTRKK